MKTLYESILSSTKSGAAQFTEKNIGNLFPRTNLHLFFDTKKMHEDAKKLTGKNPSYPSEAFAQILTSKPILKKYYDVFFDEKMTPQDKNEKVTEAINEIFKDYLKDGHYNFFCHRSNIYRGFELGILYKAERGYHSENILILKEK